jgi:hypothetical protein
MDLDTFSHVSSTIDNLITNEKNKNSSESNSTTSAQLVKTFSQSLSAASA